MVRIRKVPFAVRPDDVGLVVLDKLLHLRQVHAARPFAHRPWSDGLVLEKVFRIVRIRVLEKRVVEAASESRSLHRRSKLARKVASRPERYCVVICGFGTWPKREAVMVLRGKDCVLRPRLLEKRGPCDRIEVLGLEPGGKVRIRCAAIVLRMMRDEVLVALQKTAVVPFGVASIHAGLACRRIRGYGIRSPVYEDSELGILPPLRNRPRVDRLPVRLILRRRGYRKRGQRRKQEILTHSSPLSAQRMMRKNPDAPTRTVPPPAKCAA